MSDGKKLVADAITQKGVTTAADAAFQTMADNVKKIETGISTDDATAVAANILTGKTAYAKGAKITGTMANRGAVSQSLSINGSYTIPAGYHSGSGKVTQSVPTQGAQTITPSTTNKTIASGRYLSGTQTIKGDANLKAANIKKGVSIFGVSGSYEGETSSVLFKEFFYCYTSGGVRNIPISKIPTIVVTFNPNYDERADAKDRCRIWNVGSHYFDYDGIRHTFTGLRMEFEDGDGHVEVNTTKMVLDPYCSSDSLPWFMWVL